METSKDVSNATESTASSNDQVKTKQEILKVDVDGEEMPVSYGSFNKLVGQVKKTKELYRQQQEELENYKRQEQQREEARLAEKGEYSKLVDLKDGKINELNQRLQEIENEKNSAYQTLNDAKKMSAVYEKLPGRLKNNKYMQFIDVESVVIDPETGDINQESAAMVANKFMEEHVDLVDTSHVGRLKGTASSQTVPINKSFKSLPLKDMRKNVAEAVRLAKQEKGLI